ncbi:MAG: peptidoglycan editing factor PgeF [Thiogranum sp.]|nr:peptidoglycan editing factor PgeF [Thiogranum sp.]
MMHPDWPAPAGVKAVTTTRAEGGASCGAYADFNLALHVGDVADAVQQNRRRLRQLLELPAEPAWLDQVHGQEVIDAAGVASAPAADASFSFGSGAVCAVLTADCLPVLFCDRSATRVAAAHAGWRGLAGGVLERTVAALQCAPGELLAWLGPAIGPRHFEVGEEVREAFVSAHREAAPAFERQPAGNYLADLYQLAKIRLQAAGVESIYGGGFCTYAEPERWYSYRREHTTGRMASLIWLS